MTRKGDAMYQEDAEAQEHERQLVEAEGERREGTGQVDSREDDWIEDDPFKGVLMKVRDDIGRVGWSSIGVFAAVGDDDADFNPFLYTIGLRTTYQHPELIVYGLRPTQAHSILYSAIEQIKMGVRFEPGARYEHVLGGDYAVVFHAVQASGRPLNVARAYYESDVEALQLVWPDQEGRFPGEEDVDPIFATAQEPNVEDDANDPG